MRGVGDRVSARSLLLLFGVNQWHASCRLAGIMDDNKVENPPSQSASNTDGPDASGTGLHGASVVFVRRNATLGIGHVGWGFLVHFGDDEATSMSGDANLWEIGAVENHSGAPI